MTAVAEAPGQIAKRNRRWRLGAHTRWLLLTAPMTLTLGLVFLLPIGSLIVLSFYSMTGPATVGDQATLENYRQFATDPFYFKIILNTFWLAGLVTFCCLVVGYPVSYFLARTRSRWRGLLLFLVVAPLLVSAVVRNIGWFPILSN